MAVTGRDVSIIQMAEGDSFGGPAIITDVYFRGATTQGHLCELLDASGGTRICRLEADADLNDQHREFWGPNGKKGMRFANLHLNDLDSGEVFIHLR